MPQCYVLRSLPLLFGFPNTRGSVYGTSLVLQFLCCSSACLSVGWRNDWFLNSKACGRNTSSRVLWYRRTPRKPHGLCLNQVAREYEPEVLTCTVCDSLCCRVSAFVVVFASLCSHVSAFVVVFASVCCHVSVFLPDGLRSMNFSRYEKLRLFCLHWGSGVLSPDCSSSSFRTCVTAPWRSSHLYGGVLGGVLTLMAGRSCGWSHCQNSVISCICLGRVCACVYIGLHSKVHLRLASRCEGVCEARRRLHGSVMPSR